MEKDKEYYTRKEKCLISLSILVISAVIVIFVVCVSRSTIEGNVLRRVTNESEFLAKQQAEFINKVIEEQFHKAATLSGMLEKGLSFDDEGDRRIMSSFVENNELSMLGYIDESGNLTNQDGEQLGNVVDQDYFQDIITGKKEQICCYMKTTSFGNEPRIVFFSAVHQDGKVKGIVFFSKEVDLLKDSLFQQSMFNGKECSLIVDSKGDILVKNDRALEKHPAAKNMNDLYSDSEKLISVFQSKEKGSTIWGDKKEEVFAYSRIHENDWYLICVIDTDVARQEYASNLMSIQQSIILLSIVFTLTIIYCITLVFLRVRSKNREYKEYKKRYERILSLLEKMNCMILEYDVRTKKVKSNESFEEMFGYGIQNELFNRMPEENTNHPEFDYGGFVRELNYAIAHKVTTSFETSYCEDGSIYKMMSIVMMPLINENGRVTKVFLSFRETSDEHLQLKEMTDMFDQIPGGTYRYYLNYPARLEYAGKNLCKMLGYTVEEFYEIIGSNYYEIIVEKDREKYKKFLRQATRSQGVTSCQYSMKCKNGETIDVLDTMESIENSPNIMYGYSVVVDITEYVKRRNIIEQEFVQLEQNLEMMRVQNSTSQMQPHFLYNALSSIREVILIDPQYASDLIYDFTVYLRACIRTMQNGNLVSIHQEVNSIRAYVNIEKMRMGDRLKVNYDLQSEEFEIVPLSIQPLVENAVRHGIYPKGREGGIITIKTETLRDYNLITVKDNGVGFDYQKVRNEVESGIRDSIGLDNVMFRLKKQLQANIVIKSKIGEGTVVTVSVRRERKYDESDNS